MITMEGTIEISLEEFWDFVEKKHPNDKGLEIRYGVPRINRENQTIDIDFAASSESNPSEWAVKPKAVTQWEELKP